jgi:thiol-disulfide isomerase/thioredoxin
MNKIICLLLLACFQSAHAEIPDTYQPVVIKPPFSFTERRIDLTPALLQARQLNKPVLVYLGATDCPPCKTYTAFLEKHQEAMRPTLASVVLVDIRTWLKGPKLVFQIDGQSFTPAEFKAHVGDAHASLVFPSWWLLDPVSTRQLRQMPRGAGEFVKLESHTQLITGL